MKIGLIADTHIPEAAKELPPQVARALAGVDIILHGGDIYVPAALDWLEALAPVVAALGNGDYRVREDPRVKYSQVLSLDGIKVGLVHAIIYPERSWKSLEQTMEGFFGGPVDVIVFGDSHISLVERCKGVLLVNPGSPTLPENLYGLGTVGILEVSAGQAQASIIRLR